MKGIQLLLVTLLSVSWAWAQSTVRGTVLGEGDKPLELANVVVLSLPDSSFVKGVACDRSGQFVLEGIPRECILVVSHMGYERQIVRPEGGMQIRLRAQDATRLEGLTVSASAVVHNPNGYRYSLEGSKLARGIQTLQLMERLPHMSVVDG